MNRAVIVICDSLRRDLITPADAPFLCELGHRSAQFVNHAGVFPSTTRTSAASIATGCLPARHGLLGNTMALDEGDGLVCLSVGKPDFRDRLHRATGRTLHMPTMAERLARAGDSAIAFSNVSPGAAYFLDPDGHGWVYNAAGSFGPGRRSLPAEEGLAVAKGDAGDTAVTERFCAEVLRERAPALALLWLSEPDYTGHHTPLGSPAHRAAIASADENVRRVAETVAKLDPGGEDILFVVGSDHGMESVDETIDLDALLVAAGLKRAPGSSEVVVAPNGTAALIYFAEPESTLVAEVARFLETEPWVGRVFTGGALGGIGLPIGLAGADCDHPEGRRPRQSARRAGPQPHRPRFLGAQGHHRLRPAWRAWRQRAAPVPVRPRRRLRRGNLSPAARRWSTSRRRCCAISASPPTGLDGRPLPRHPTAA